MTVTGSVMLASTVVLGMATMPLNAQAKTGETPTANSNKEPSWQIAAGGQMSFEVASIRLAEPGARFQTNINLNLEDEPIPIGGRLSATATLGSYIALAYKFMPFGALSDAVLATFQSGPIPNCSPSKPKRQWSIPPKIKCD